MRKYLIGLLLLAVLVGCAEKPQEQDDFNVSSIEVDEAAKVAATITYVGPEAEKTIYHGGNIFFLTISIEVDEAAKVAATITYVGPEAEKTIYHGGNIFFLTIKQLDGDFEQPGAMSLPLLSTTLKKDEPHTVIFDDVALDKGLYEFEAIARISLDQEDIVGSEITIPVKVEKQIN